MQAILPDPAGCQQEGKISTPQGLLKTGMILGRRGYPGTLEVILNVPQPPSRRDDATEPRAARALPIHTQGSLTFGESALGCDA
jgi:hypothetical protein